jgi:hypothetical protein
MRLKTSDGTRQDLSLPGKGWQPAGTEYCVVQGRPWLRSAFFAYSTNYLVDVRAGVIVDVEATSAHRTKEVDATRTMIDRAENRFALKPTRLIGDMAYGAADLLAWMVNDKAIEPHVPLWDKT